MFSQNSLPLVANAFSRNETIMKNVLFMLALICFLPGCSSEPKNSFGNVDKNKDGGIIFEELVFVDPTMPFKKFSMLDVDRNKKLDKHEYEAYLHPQAVAQSPPVTHQQAQTEVSSLPAANTPSIKETPASTSTVKPQTVSPLESTQQDVPQSETQQVAEEDMTPSSTPQRYTVKNDDTFWGIADSFHISVKALTTANPDINPQKLRPGVTLHIPEETVSEQADEETQSNDTVGTTTHTVGSDETVWMIAKLYGVSTKELLAANPEINPKRLRPGTRIKIPQQ